MDKLKIINSMPFVDHSACGGELEYVHTINSDKVREALVQIGATPKEITEAISDDGETIDLSVIAFTRTDAKWFEGTSVGFINYVPDHAPEWAK